MTSRSTIVVLHAHPDDEAIFTGATIRRLADRGHRVVLVTATAGEAGVPRVPLSPGESLGDRRVAELERACELLGIQRLVLLGYSDSGAHAGPFPTGSLGAAPVARVAAQVADVVRAEGARALLHYDTRGIYGHVDHVQVHRAGARVVERLGVTGYEATVDAARLRRRGAHVLRQAAGDDLDVGVCPTQISVSVRADVPGLLAKIAAMGAHASQIGPQYLDPLAFDDDYRREWFVRRGAPGVLEELEAQEKDGSAVREALRAGV